MSKAEHGARPAAPKERTDGLLGAAGAVSAATMISRILGVAREMVMARYFGAGMATDAFNVAYRIPNLLRDLFAEGALSSAFVPTFVREYKARGREGAWLLASVVLNALAVILGALSLMFFFGAKWFVFILASGFAESPEKFELTVQMTRILSPFLLFVALAAVVMGMLNSRGIYFVPAAAPSAFNVCCILAGIFLSPIMPALGLEPIVSMAIGAIAGGASQLLVQLPTVYRAGYRYAAELSWRHPGLRQIGRLMLPAVVGLSATQINITVDTQIASRFGDGPVSWLNYGFRLMQLPLGLFGMAIATAALVTISGQAARGEMDRFRSTIASSLKLAACLTFPSMVGLIVFREEIVRLLFERGSFQAGDTLQTSRVLVLYVLALFSYSAVKVLVRAFYALGRTRTPVRASVFSVAVKIAVNFALIFPMGYLGLALATSLASWLNMALLLRGLGAQAGFRLNRRDYSVFLRTAAASAAMGMGARLIYHAGVLLIPPTGTFSLAATLGAGLFAGMLVYLPLLRLFGVEEEREINGLVRKWLARVLR